MEDETTNPAELEAVTPEVAQDETPDDADETSEETADDDQEGEQPEPEFIEVEHKGKMVRIPKDAEDLLMFQKDYTQKTQSLSEQRREYEQQRQAFDWERQMTEAMTDEVADLRSISKRLDQFKGMDWQAAWQQNPQQAGALQAEYTMLRDHQDRLAATVEERKQAIAAKREQDTAITQRKALEVLGKPNPAVGWDGKFDAAKSQELTSFGLQIGFTNEELSNTSHPLMIQTLNLARIGYKHLMEQRKTPPRPAAQPAAKVPAARATASRDPLRDDAPIDQWVKARNAQVAKQGRR